MVAENSRLVGKSKRAVNRLAQVSQNGQSRSVSIAAGGIETSEDFTALMSALMTDLLEGSVDAAVGNAVVNAGGKLLKVAELRLRYGSKQSTPSINLIG